MLKFREMALLALLLLQLPACAQEFSRGIDRMPPETDKMDNPWADSDQALTPMPQVPGPKVASNPPGLSGSYMGVSGPNRGPYGYLPPTATSSVDISICDRFTPPVFQSSKPTPNYSNHQESYWQPSGGGGTGGNIGYGGPDDGPSYIEFEDGTKAFYHPRRLSPGIMFDCTKGYFDMSNPGAGWQSTNPSR